MRILPEPIAFQWDEGNTEHIKKHDVSPRKPKRYSQESLFVLSKTAIIQLKQKDVSKV
jgi:hypothetical protein